MPRTLLVAGTRLVDPDQLLPPSIGPGAHIYPLRGADPATARKWLARAKLPPKMPAVTQSFR